MIVIVCYSLVALFNIATLKMLMMLNVSVISCHLRLDKGTETGIMATIHGFLRREHEDVSNAKETVQYGPSTCNKVLQVTALKDPCHCNLTMNIDPMSCFHYTHKAIIF